MTRRFTRHMFLAASLTTGVLLTPAGASGRPTAGAPQLDALMAQWRASHGPNWQVLADRQTGYAEMIYGGNVRSDVHPREDAEFEPLALEALLSTQAMHGVDLENLVFERATFLPLGMYGTTTDKETVRHRQEVNGVRVVNGFTNVLFSADGALLSVHSTAMPHLAGFDTTPVVEPLDAAGPAIAAFMNANGIQPTEIGQPELVIDQIVVDGQRTARLAYLVNVLWKVDGFDPIGTRYSVDARNGSILRSEASVHFDVSGTVSAMSTPNLLPDTGANGPASQIMKYLRVTSASGTVYTDANGFFNYPGVNAPLSVTFQFTAGQRANVMNSNGAEYSLNVVLQPNQANAVLLNPAPIGTVTAQANALRCLAFTSDFIHSLVAGDTHADFSALANVNLSQTCNAYFDGGSTNYFLPGGGCPNTAYSTIVSHEFGHWMNVLYNTGNGSDGMGEGNADVWANYIWDTPVIGQNFFGSGSNIRTGLNNTMFCGDCCGGCHGEVHFDGEVWMGAAWKVRTNLKNTHGTVIGGGIANGLFMGWMNSYNQTQIRSIIETQWMTLNDDDGNISNGAPDFTDIDNGFRAQGFPGLVVVCPTPATYCSTTPNSATNGAVVSFSGTNDISNNNFRLLANLLPANKLVIPFYGQTQTFVPFGNGMRCVANPFFRLPTTTSNVFGDVDVPIDLNNLPVGGEIGAGETWNFQVYFRDPAGGGAAFDSSDAIMVPWCQ